MNNQYINSTISTPSQSPIVFQEGSIPNASFLEMEVLVMEMSHTQSMQYERDMAEYEQVCDKNASMGIPAPPIPENPASKAVYKSIHINLHEIKFNSWMASWDEINECETVKVSYSLMHNLDITDQMIVKTTLRQWINFIQSFYNSNFIKLS